MKICPRCGSTNVDWIIPQNWSLWVCKTCGYTGPIIEGNKRIAEEIKNDYEITLKKEKRKNKLKKENEKENYENKDNNDMEEDLTDEEIDRRLKNLDI
ncbi:hypothetical protein MBCUT_17290 [Methanobrevibacter cuticularis]|uniref:Uncharacterized protein n=1 Tax=Methanobrevibacter cuticularis TaxID=47311 RepID=A0A166D1H5_9EURY|nr:hypothetical protein [Methanobrevibacter cuticularis]KZX15106.1 hypothetical protein MBCUT_17290 [Methanobrevibacter cuticularis]